MTARRTSGASSRDRERAVRLADLAREHDWDLTLQWDDVIGLYNDEQRAIGGFTIRPPATPLLALAVAARAAMCRHGLSPEACHGDQHHVWEDQR